MIRLIAIDFVVSVAWDVLRDVRDWRRVVYS